MALLRMQADGHIALPHTTWQFLYTTTFLKPTGKGFLNYTVLVYGSKPQLFFEQTGTLTQPNPPM